MALRFNMLLVDAGIAPRNVRLLRHQTGKVLGRSPYTLWRDDPEGFERYQNTQTPARRSSFDRPYWASFVAPPDGSTLFVGLYAVRRVGSVREGQIDPLTLVEVGAGTGAQPYDQYECVPVPALAELAGRLKVH